MQGIKVNTSGRISKANHNGQPMGEQQPHLRGMHIHLLALGRSQPKARNQGRLAGKVASLSSSKRKATALGMKASRRERLVLSLLGRRNCQTTGPSRVLRTKRVLLVLFIFC